MTEVAQQTGSDQTALRPFQVNVPEAALVPFDVIRHEHNISGRYGCRESKSSREEHPCHLGGNA